MKIIFATPTALLLVGIGGCSHLLTGTLAFSFPVILTQRQQIPSWPLFAAYDDDRNNNNEESPNNNNAAIIPAGEEALHSARMARSIRQFRTTRGRVKENRNREETDEESIMDHRGSLLTKPSRTSNRAVPKDSTETANKRRKAKKQPKVKISAEMEFVDERPKRSNGMDLPYQSTIQALREYYKIHGDLVMPRRYPVPEDKGMLSVII